MFVRALAAAFCLVAFCAQAQSQQRPSIAQNAQAPAAPATPPPVTGPENTSARFGDWVLRCNTGPNGKVCEMVQTLQIQNQAGQQAPFALLAIGRAGKGEPMKFITQLPSNVTIANGIVVEAKPDRPIAGAFTRCLPIGCFAEVVIADDVRRRWMTRVEAGVVRFHDGANQQLSLPLSFRGFNLAMEAMLKEVP